MQEKNSKKRTEEIFFKKKRYVNKADGRKKTFYRRLSDASAEINIRGWWWVKLVPMKKGQKWASQASPTTTRKITCKLDAFFMSFTTPTACNGLANCTVVAFVFTKSPGSSISNIDDVSNKSRSHLTIRLHLQFLFFFSFLFGLCKICAYIHVFLFVL